MKAHRKNLNVNQLVLLQLMHKFRFVTAPLLAEHKSVDKSVITRSLQRLKEQGYVDRFYDKSYKLLGKPATYFLTKKSINYLKENTAIDETSLNSHYKNRRVGTPFIEHSLAIYHTYLDIENQQPDTFDIYTRIEIAGDDSFPHTPPALYLSRKNPSNKLANHYMLDIFAEDTQFWLIRKRIDQYVEHFEDGNWLESEYPSIIILYPSHSLKEKALEHIENAKDNNFIEDDDLLISIVTNSDELFIV